MFNCGRGGTVKMKKYVWLATLCLTVFLTFGSTAQAATADKGTPPPIPDKATFARDFEEAKMTSLAAATCAGTYVPGGQANEYGYLAEYGFKVTPYSQKINGVEVNFMVAVNQNVYRGKKLTVMAFRGSMSKDDWKLDLTTGQTPFTPNGFVNIKKQNKEKAPSTVPQIHKGFNAYTLATLQCKVDIDGDGVPDDIAQTLIKNPDRTLLLTGHSLGGAVATLYGEYMVARGVPKDQIPIITFGGPAIGNAAFAEQYGNKVNLLRLSTSFDPVPVSLQGIFGGYKQFGKAEMYDLAGTYTDNQHSISFYADLALRKFFNMEDQGIAYGYLAPLPLTKIEGEEAPVAIALTAMDNGPDKRFAPDIKHFVLEEYLSIFPSYVVIESNLNKQEENAGFQQLVKKADKAGAKYLVTLEVDRHRVAQTNQWFVGINQGIFTVPQGNMLSIDSHNTRVTFQQGIVQSTIAMLERCKNTTREKLPFVNQNQPLILREVL